jgi:hypothetical protein
VLEVELLRAEGIGRPVVLAAVRYKSLSRVQVTLSRWANRERSKRPPETMKVTGSTPAGTLRAPVSRRWMVRSTAARACLASSGSVVLSDLQYWLPW